MFRRLLKLRNSKDGIPFRMCELFSGIGAQRMGARQYNVPVDAVATSEIDKFALKSYEAIWGDNPNMGDICGIGRLPDNLDILTYSFPCQSLSMASFGQKGIKRGMRKDSGSKSSLLWEVQRLLEVAYEEGDLPKWLIMENVPNIHGPKNVRDFDKWIGFLSDLGYASRWSDLNAKDFGVPQNRKRCFLLSHLGDSCPELPEGHGKKTVIADILEDIVPERYFLTDERLEGLKRSNRLNESKGIGFRFKPLDKHRDVSHTVTTHEGGRKCSTFIYDRCRQIGELEGYNAHDRSRRIYDKYGLSPTVTCVTGGGHETKILDKERVRKLTPRETWRLQGQPDWAFDRAAKVSSVSQLYHQSGNSIAVPVIGSIMKTIDETDIMEKEGKH